MDHVRLFVSFPEELVDRPMIYEIVKRFDVVPNIRRANVEAHSGWVILELGGSPEQRDAAIAYLEGVGCTVNPWKATSSRDDAPSHRGRRRSSRPAAPSARPATCIVDGVERELPGWVSVRSRSSSTRGVASTPTARSEADRADDARSRSATRRRGSWPSCASCFALDPADADRDAARDRAQRVPRADRGARGGRGPPVERDGSTSGRGPTTATAWCRTRSATSATPTSRRSMLAWGMAKAAVLRAAPGGQREYPYGHNALERCLPRWTTPSRHDWSTR